MRARAVVVSGVRRRLLFLGGLVVAAFMMSAAASYVLLADVQIGGAAYDLVLEKNAAMRRLRDLESDLQRVRLLVASMLSERDKGRLGLIEDEIERALYRVSLGFKQTLEEDTELDEWVGTRAAQRTWDAFARTMKLEVVPAVLAGDTSHAYALLSGLQARRAERFTEQLDTSLGVLAMRLSDAETRAVSSATKTWGIALTTWLVLAGLLLLALLAVAKSISRPLETLTLAAEGIARGERPERVDAGGEDEVGALSSAFNEMLGLLGETSRRARRSDALLETALESLSKESDEVRHFAREQNASLASISSDLSQISAGATEVVRSTSRGSDAARQAAIASARGAEMVREAGEEFARLKEAVDQTAGRVRELLEDARQVTGFADVITEIANETHLLALNAGLEAARAGHHGKGFALIASRVRELARAASAEASRVRAVVTRTRDSVTAVDEATKEAGDAADKGAEAAEKLNASFASILESVNQTEEAASEVEQVVQAQVESLRRSTELARDTDRTVTSNAESVERMAAQVRHLGEVADDLRALLDRLGGSAGGGREGGA